MRKNMTLFKGFTAIGIGCLLLSSQNAISAGESAEVEPELSAECLQMQANLDADLAEQQKKGCPPSLAQMSKLMDNPVGNVAMLFTQFDFVKMTNESVYDDSASKTTYMGIAQFPKSLGPEWNLINRVVWTVPSMPLDQDKIDAAGGGTFGEGQNTTLPPVGGSALPINIFDGRTTGFGDLYYVGLFSPKKSIPMGSGAFVWGAGFDIGAPTATDDILGTGKWTAGPTGLGIYMGEKWKFGALWQQYFDFAGDSDRDDVNLSNLQYLYYYSLNDTTSIGAGPNIIINWEQDSDNRFTVPIGIGINKTFQFGKIPVRIGVEAHYSVIQPDDVPGNEWDIRFFIIPAVPSFMFDWMQ